MDLISVLKLMPIIFKGCLFLFPKSFNKIAIFRKKLTLKSGFYEDKVEDNGSLHIFKYFCLIVNNNSNKKLYVNKNSLMVNNERFDGVILMNNKKIENVAFYLNEYEEFMMCFQSIMGGMNQITGIKKNSLLFFPQDSISVTLEIDKKEYELGVKSYKLYINYLASLFGIIPWELPKKL